VTNKNPCVFENYGTAKFQILTDPELSGIEIECVQTRKEKYNKETRNPATAYGTIEEDAMRRDLTINALYYNISTDEICDYTNRGLDDIKNQVIRTTGKADLIFDDDPLRILRVVRFATRLGWKIEKDTWVGMIMNSKRIGILTQERVTDEINKMLLGDNPSEAMRMLDRCNVLHRIFPALTMSKHVYQDIRPIRTLYEHTLETLDKTPKVLETRLAAIFHDVGKLKTYDKGFMYHSQIGADMAEEVLKAMKYSNAVVNTVKKAIEYHEDFSSYFSGTVPRPAVIRKFVSKFEGNDKDLEVALDLIHANNITQMYGKKVKLVPGIKQKIAELDKKQESGKKIVIPINGKDIMDHFGLKPGPTLGLIMDKVKSKVIEDPSVTKEELFKYVQEYITKVV
jgi:poly(A) polymerase